MHIVIEWHDKNFNINLHSSPDKEAFLSIKGCRLVENDKGGFIGFPAKKNEQTQKYWNHVWANDEFQQHVIKLAKAAIPASQKAPSKTGNFDQMKDDIPFANPYRNRYYYY